MRTINIILAVIVTALFATLIINLLAHFIGDSNVFLGCVIIVMITGVSLVVHQLYNYFRSNKCAHCKTRLNKNNTRASYHLFNAKVCDKPDCLITTWEKERELDINQ